MKTFLDFESRNTKNGASREMIITPKAGEEAAVTPTETMFETFKRYGYTGTEGDLVSAIMILVENVGTLVPPVVASEEGRSKKKKVENKVEE